MKIIFAVLLFFSLSTLAQPYTPITNPEIQKSLDSAVSHFKENEIDKGFNFFDQAISIDSNNLTVFQLKSSWESYFQKFENALKTTLKQIQIRPDVAYFYLDAGLFLRRLGDSTKSLPYFKKAIALFDIEINVSTNRDSSRPIFLRAVAMLFSDQTAQGKNMLKNIYEETKEYSSSPLWGHLDEPLDLLIIRWLDPKMHRDSQ